MSASSDTMLFSPIGSSGINRYMTRLQEDKGDSHQQHSRIKLVRGQPGLLSAVEREDFEDLMNRNSDYIQQVLSGQGETLDSLTSMIDVLGEKLKSSSSASMDLVEKLSSLVSLIDDEKRKWIVQNDAEKQAEIRENMVFSVK